MIGTTLRRFGAVALVAASLLVACGGSSPPPETAPDEPGRCVVDPEVAATRQPSPPDAIDCSAWTALSEACSGGEPSACYQFAVCLTAQEATMAASLSPEERAQHVTAALAGLRVACDGGVAEACKLRLGLQMDDGQPLPADGCADLVRSCNLGDDEGCAGCRYHDCD